MGQTASTTFSTKSTENDLNCPANGDAILAEPLNLCRDCAAIDFEAAFSRKSWNRAAKRRGCVHLQKLNRRSDWGRFLESLKTSSNTPPSDCWLCQNLIWKLLGPAELLLGDDRDFAKLRLGAHDRWRHTSIYRPLVNDKANGSSTKYQGPEHGFYIAAAPEKHEGLLQFRKTPLVCVREISRPELFEPCLISPLVDLELVQSWLRACDKYHANCARPPTQPIRNMRLIDCENREIVCAEPEMVYVALSYVWGIANTDTLRSWNSQLANLPRSIEDAISITKKSGYRYLWVDRYCIDQSDDFHKASQIEVMDQIYQSAAFTIIAAAGENHHYGIPGIQKKRKTQRKSLGRLTFSEYINPKDESEQSTWNSRGWTFQEFILSQRRLIFTESSVSLLCQDTWAHDLRGCIENITSQEAMDEYQQAMPASSWNLVRDSLPSEDCLMDEKYKMVISVLTAYSKRVFTFQTDVFSGFQGISKRFERGSSPVFNIMGIPFAFQKNSSTVRNEPTIYAPGASANHIHEDQYFAGGLGWNRRRHAFQQLSDNGALYPSWSWGNFMGKGVMWSGELTTLSELELCPKNVRLQDDNGGPEHTLAECAIYSHRVSAKTELCILHLDALLFHESALRHMKQIYSSSMDFDFDDMGFVRKIPGHHLNPELPSRLSDEGWKYAYDQVALGNWGVILLHSSYRTHGESKPVARATFLVLKWHTIDTDVWASRIGHIQLWSSWTEQKPSVKSLVSESKTQWAQIKLR